MNTKEVRMKTEEKSINLWRERQHNFRESERATRIYASSAYRRQPLKVDKFIHDIQR